MPPPENEGPRQLSDDVARIVAELVPGHTSRDLWLWCVGRVLGLIAAIATVVASGVRINADMQARARLEAVEKAVSK